MSQEGENRLPSDCWLLIFSLLSDADLNALSLSCKAFRANSILLKKRLKVIHPEISMLSQHLEGFSQIKNIDLVHFEGDIVEAIREIGRSGISLESLDVPIHNFFEEELMESLRGWGSNLKALRLEHSSYDVDADVDVAVIANTFPNLEELEIDGNPTDFGYGPLASSKLGLLKKIHLYSCKVGDAFIIALSLNCVLLKDVVIDGSHSVTETGVGHLFRNRPNLEALSFTKRDHNEDELEFKPHYSSSINIENSISHAKALTCLDLSYMLNTDKVLKAIAKAKLGLNILRLTCFRGLTASGLLAVLSNHPLTELKLVVFDFTEEDLKVVILNGNVSHLTHIEIGQCSVKGSTLSLLSERCPSLVEITMSGVMLYDQVELNIFYSFSKNHEISCLRLNLDYCSGNDDEFFKQLGLLFPNLKSLHLGSYKDTPISIGIEAILKSCKHIKELSLCGMLIEANDPELVESNLEVLTLSLRIDDEGLAAIAKKCPRLLSLDLAHCGYITEEGIKQVIQTIKTLTSLTLMQYDHDLQNHGALLEWMLSTRNLASLNKIFLQKENFTAEQRSKFLQHGCLLSSAYPWWS